MTYPTEPPKEQVNPGILLADLTYAEVLESKKPVSNSTGYLVGGPDRRGANAMPPAMLWKLWQQDVQGSRKKLRPAVRDYFERTKHLERPPKPGADITIYGGNPSIFQEPLQFKETDMGLFDDLGGEVQKPVQARKNLNPPRFATSFTGMESFCQCPRKWAAEKYYKTVPYKETAATIWGNRGHKTAENYLLNGGASLDGIGGKWSNLKVEEECLPFVQKYCDAILRSGADKILVEHEICCTKDLVPCGWKDWNTVWFRFKGDVIVIKNRVLKYYDWKFGKVPDPRYANEEMPKQSEVAIALANLKYGDLFDTAEGTLIYVKESDPKSALHKDRVITKDDIPGIWSKIFAITNRMEQACESEVFQARSSGLCKAYCGDLTCPHNGLK